MKKLVLALTLFAQPYCLSATPVQPPALRPISMVLVDGEVIQGYFVGKDVANVTYQTSDGKASDIPVSKVKKIFDGNTGQLLFSPPQLNQPQAVATPIPKPVMSSKAMPLPELLAEPTPATKASGRNFAVRVAGGYGFSLNSANYGTGTPDYPLSPGIPMTIEMSMAITEHMELGLSENPVLMSRTWTTNYTYVGNTQTDSGTDSAVFLPIYLNAYYHHSLWDQLSGFGGIGFGFVPPTTIKTTYTNSDTYNQSLAGGLGVKVELGAQWTLSQTFSTGLSLQYMYFDQAEAWAQYGWSGNQFSQIAPMFFIRADL